MASPTRTGLALSGGGFRAATFHLGVLKRLEELELLTYVDLLSTVSGGSMTGALYALRCVQQGDGRPGSYPVSKLIEEVRPLVTSNLRGKALLGSPARAIRTSLSFLTRKVSRMPLLVDELDRRLYGGATVAELPPWILINATNLTTGKSWKFFHDRTGDYLIGATDKTDHIGIAEAVGASAAYPVLTDPYPFHTTWQELRADLLDERWARPPVDRPGGVSRWRRTYGRTEGPVTLPLADGGLYDNEGLNGIRSARTPFTVYASTAGPATHFTGGRGAASLLRMVEVIHSRLGAVSRQHAHEMTHGTHPTEVRERLLALAQRVEQFGGDGTPDSEELASIADALASLADVGWPPRGHQYAATAPILLHRTDLATNRFAEFEPPYHVPPEAQGLTERLASALSRVRTDLDALRPGVVDLLIAQAYFLTDAHVKVGTPELVKAATTEMAAPAWPWAHAVIEAANANERVVLNILEDAARRRLLYGRRAGSEAVQRRSGELPQQAL